MYIHTYIHICSYIIKQIVACICPTKIVIDKQIMNNIKYVNYKKRFQRNLYLLSLAQIIKLHVTTYVTQSDKIGLIAEKYTCSVYGVYHLICGCYLNIVYLFNSLGFYAYMVKI